MIKTVKVISRIELIQYQGAIFSGAMARYFCCNATQLVSIHSTNRPPALSPSPENMLTMQFDDLVIPTDWGITPSIEHANQIANFIEMAHSSEHEVLLVAQCDGGSSRSGAVGEYARHIAAIERSAFLKENPQINPNKLLIELFSQICGTPLLP